MLLEWEGLYEETQYTENQPIVLPLLGDLGLNAGQILQAGFGYAQPAD